MRSFCIILLAIVSTTILRAQTQTASIFTDHMIMQQSCEAPIWGWGNAAETVTIIASWSPQDTVRVTVQPDGQWRAALSTPKADGQRHTIKVGGLTIKDVRLGEVWLCSGQSNMQWSVNSGINDGEAEAAAANNPDINIFHVPMRGADTPQLHCEATWTPCTPETMRRTSAVAYFFARTLQKDLDTPIGIIVSAWGGTTAEVWTPAELIELNPSLKQNAIVNSNQWWPHRNGGLFNQMINPLAPYAIAGTIWYQGESNVSNAEIYTSLMQTMLWGWRARFDRDFPFYFVQIAPFKYGVGQDKAATLREAQERFAATTPKTGMVVISDLVNDTGNIHPTDKQNVGLRLANMALAEVYAKPIKGYKSPTAQSMTVEKGKAVITLRDVTDKLVVRGDSIVGLELAGEDGIFHEAQGVVKGDRLIISSEAVSAPVEAEFCFDEATVGNLFSGSGLPVAPFRISTTK